MLENQYIIYMEIDAFWNRVKLQIKKKGVTQQEIARACDLPHDTLRGWMSKRIIPPLSDAFALARYLGVSLEFLVDGRDTDRASKICDEILLMLNEAGEMLKEIRPVTRDSGP